MWHVDTLATITYNGSFDRWSPSLPAYGGWPASLRKVPSSLQYTNSQRGLCLTLVLWCPQGEQGEDGKAEGPPGPPGDRVSSLSVPPGLQCI